MGDFISSSTLSVGGDFFNAALGVASDMSAFLLVVIFTMIFAFTVGRDKLLTLTASLYSGTVLYYNFPLDTYVTSDVMSLGVYVLMVTASFFALVQIGMQSMESFFGTVRVTLYSLAIAGFVTALAVHTPALASVYTFSPEALAIFEPPTYYFGWLFLPLVATFFLSK